MKTKELIEQLQKLDPTGELNVFYGEESVFIVERLPMYYDGAPVLIIEDETKQNGYNVIGAKWLRKGNKICIRTLSLEDALWENSDLPVEYDEWTDVDNSLYHDKTEKIRKEVKDWEAKNEKAIDEGRVN